MKRFCRLRKSKEPSEKVVAFTSQEQAPKVLAIPSRPMASTLLQKFTTDNDLLEGMGVLKGSQFYEFDRVFFGHNR